jgi:transketolase N-terminal domain/subunit
MHMKEAMTVESRASVRGEDVARLKRLANKIRYSALTMTNHARLVHTGSDMSAAYLATLYLGNILRVTR